MFNVGDVVIVNGYWPATGLKPMSIATVVTPMNNAGYFKLRPRREEDKIGSMGNYYASSGEISHYHYSFCEKFHG